MLFHLAKSVCWLLHALPQRIPDNVLGRKMFFLLIQGKNFLCFPVLHCCTSATGYPILIELLRCSLCTADMESLWRRASPFNHPRGALTQEQRRAHSEGLPYPR